MIKIQNLCKSLYGGGHEVGILTNLNLHVPPGQFIAVTGPSGSGKSTLLGLMAGLDTATSGRVFLDGKDLTQMDENSLARLRGQSVGIIFQNFHLIPTLTALENVSIPCLFDSGHAFGFIGGFAWNYGRVFLARDTFIRDQPVF